MQHPIIEDLLLVRAQTALADKLYAPADEDARALLDRYPGSTLKAAALGVRLSVAWDLKRKRAVGERNRVRRAHGARKRTRRCTKAASSGGRRVGVPSEKTRWHRHC